MDPSQAPPCAVDAHWDCGIVNHSRFSYFPPKGFDEDATSTKLHIPVATLGIAGYAVMFVLAAFGRWWLLLMVAEIGFGGALMLTYLEAYVIEKWCIYCLWSQCIMAAILAATFLAFYLRRRPLSSPGYSRRLMSLTRQQALDCFASHDLIGIGMEADAVPPPHPPGRCRQLLRRPPRSTSPAISCPQITAALDHGATGILLETGGQPTLVSARTGPRAHPPAPPNSSHPVPLRPGSRPALP